MDYFLMLQWRDKKKNNFERYDLEFKKYNYDLFIGSWWQFGKYLMKPLFGNETFAGLFSYFTEEERTILFSDLIYQISRLE